MLTIIYFASLKDRIGRAQEQIEFPDGVDTLAALMSHLSTVHGEAWSSAIHGSTTLMAVNQEMCDKDAAIKDGDEIAFFPPVTGG